MSKTYHFAPYYDTNQFIDNLHEGMSTCIGLKMHGGVELVLPEGGGILGWEAGGEGDGDCRKQDDLIRFHTI